MTMHVQVIAATGEELRRRDMPPAARAVGADGKIWLPIQQAPPPGYDTATHKLVPVKAATASAFVEDWQVVALTQAELDDRRASTIASVKAEARRRILAFLPDWKQSNLNARANELNRNRVVNGGLTAGEQAEETAMLALWADVKAIRSASDTFEAAIAGMTDAAVAALDVTNPVHWA